MEPYRGTFGDPRPARLGALALPPGPMPSHHRLRPLKAWRYVGIFSPQLMICVATVRIGPIRQAFWAVWDRRRWALSERTVIGGRGVRLDSGHVRVVDPRVQLEIALEEAAGIESVCPSGDAYAWTRKQGGIAARGRVCLDGDIVELAGRAVVDDTAAYYERHTRWFWSAGIGTETGGRPVAWNLVAGVNDPPDHSERTVWIGDEARESPPCVFTPDLSAVDTLRFTAEAERVSRENLIVVRSRYRQPFGTFSGALPGGIELSSGLGVMEDHDVWW